MLQHIRIILVLFAASGWAFAETTDDARMKEFALRMFDDVQADEVAFKSAERLLLLRGVQFGKRREGEASCDLNRKVLTIMIRDHELRTDDRWSIAAFECAALIDLLRARGQLP